MNAQQRTRARNAAFNQWKTAGRPRCRSCRAFGLPGRHPPPCDVDKQRGARQDMKFKARSVIRRRQERSFERQVTAVSREIKESLMGKPEAEHLLKKKLKENHWLRVQLEKVRGNRSPSPCPSFSSSGPSDDEDEDDDDYEDADGDGESSDWDDGEDEDEDGESDGDDDDENEGEA